MGEGRAEKRGGGEQGLGSRTRRDLAWSAPGGQGQLFCPWDLGLRWQQWGYSKVTVLEENPVSKALGESLQVHPIVFIRLHPVEVHPVEGWSLPAHLASRAQPSQGQPHSSSQAGLVAAPRWSWPAKGSPSPRVLAQLGLLHQVKSGGCEPLAGTAGFGEGCLGITVGCLGGRQRLTCLGSCTGQS